MCGGRTAIQLASIASQAQPRETPTRWLTSSSDFRKVNPDRGFPVSSCGTWWFYWWKGVHMAAVVILQVVTHLCESIGGVKTGVDGWRLYVRCVGGSNSDSVAGACDVRAVSAGAIHMMSSSAYQLVPSLSLTLSLTHTLSWCVSVLSQ